jgi:hypothetical protein
MAKNGQRKNVSALLRKLNRLGSPVDLSAAEEDVASEPQMLTLERTGGPADSFLNALPVRGYDAVVWVRIVILKSNTNILDCQLIPQKWADEGLHLVEAAEGCPYYKGLAGDEYQKSDVLNSWISSDRILNRGDVLEGAIFLQSFGPLPAWLVDGISIEGDLCFVDQFENIYPLKVDLRVIRDERRVERPRRTGLFGPAVDPSRRGVYREQPDLGEGSSPKRPSVRATK